MSGKAPSVQLGIGNVVGTKSDMVCVDPKVEQTGQNAQVCNQAEGETSEMVTGMQLGMVNVVGAKTDLVSVEPKVEKMGQNAQVCNQVRGEMSEMVTSVQLCMVKLWGLRVTWLVWSRKF